MHHNVTYTLSSAKYSVLYLNYTVGLVSSP